MWILALLGATAGRSRGRSSVASPCKGPRGAGVRCPWCCRRDLNMDHDERPSMAVGHREASCWNCPSLGGTPRRVACRRCSMEKEHAGGSSSWIVRAREHLEHQHIHRRQASAITLHGAVRATGATSARAYKMGEPRMGHCGCSAEPLPLKFKEAIHSTEPHCVGWTTLHRTSKAEH